ncbi:MAG: SpoIIIAH-like family protein [Peptococcaceae bacterium]|nr:MAG: SpoIIIAH-like family protein [Peptococcaceae bacterium]
MFVFVKKRLLMIAFLVFLLLLLLCWGMSFIRWPVAGLISGVNVDKGRDKVPAVGEVYFTRDEVDNGAPFNLNVAGKKEESTDFFVEYRLERERTRGQQVELLREVINNANSDEETRKKAQEQLMEISRIMGKEVELENLIRARGIEDAAVLLDSRAVMVIVADNGVVSGDVYQLTDLVSRGTGLAAQDVAMVLKK